MRPQTISYLALGALVAALGCGKNLDTMAKPDETAVAPDTAQNTAGYKGQERDTAMTAADTASGNQPAPGTTVGVDTSAVPSGVDTSSTTPGIDTTGSSASDTTAATDTTAQ